MLQLPNSCYISKMQVHPLNWQGKGASVKEDWYIHYRFHDPAFKHLKQFKYGKLIPVKGMNKESTIEGRRALTKIIIQDEMDVLKNGYNPITKKSGNPLDATFELSNHSPFIRSLWLAVEKVKVSPNYLIDMKSVIRGVEAAAIELKINNTPISQITRKYIKVILEKCSELNPRWSARRYNVYRTALIALFRELIAMEAIDSNPVKEIPKLRETKKERLTLTIKERRLINKTLREKHYPFWRLIHIFFHSGSRETELLNVKGKHVDLKKQSCLYTVKKGADIREVRRPIKDIALPLWKEIIQLCGKEDYLFSTGLIPGKAPIRPEQLTRRWRRHVKKKLNINADLYSLKHSNTTEMMDELKDEKEIQKLTGHTSEALIVSIYDIKNKQRKDDKIKRVRNEF